MRSEVGHVSWRSVCLHPSGDKDVAFPYALFIFTGKRLGLCPGRAAICDFVTQNMAGSCSITHIRGDVLNMMKKICKKVTCCFWQVLGRVTQCMFFIVILWSFFTSTRNTEEVCCLKKD